MKIYLTIETSKVVGPLYPKKALKRFGQLFYTVCLLCSWNQCHRSWWGKKYVTFCCGYIYIWQAVYAIVLPRNSLRCFIWFAACGFWHHLFSCLSLNNFLFSSKKAVLEVTPYLVYQPWIGLFSHHRRLFIKNILTVHW